MAVVPAGPGDVAALAELLAEMDRFYGADDAEPVADRVRQISDAIFAVPPAAHVLLAWDGTDLAGLAARRDPQVIPLHQRGERRIHRRR